MLNLEWLETDGLGGWASSTVAGLNTRRYHGVLVDGSRFPSSRTVLVSKLDETVVLGDGTAFELGTNQYPGTIAPSGFLHLRSFEDDPFPVFEYEAGGVVLRKTVAAIHGESIRVVAYELVSAPGPITLRLLPLVAARDYHSLTKASDGIERGHQLSDGMLRVHPRPHLPPIWIQVPGGTFHPRGDWYYNVEYVQERLRGSDWREDLYSYGSFEVILEPGATVHAVLSIHKVGPDSGAALLAEERSRRSSLGERALTPLMSRLCHAADQFIIRRSDGLLSIVAGYHWFTDWGRDTMISLPGLCLSTGRFDDARAILRTFSRYLSRGMIPNRFGDADGEPEYNSVDATLWFFVAAYRYYLATGDVKFVRDELLHKLRESVEWHERGTRFKIKVGTDGLLYAGDEHTQLTWMDAKVGDWVVTPRHGAPVEVNALWYNALCILAELEERFGERGEARRLRERAAEVKRSFLERFRSEADGGLFDVLTPDGPDPSIRPNQVLAIGLPFPLVEGDDAARILELVRAHLLTPVGLRTLSPTDPSYQSNYTGNNWSRDGAYHRGTAWMWLLGPYMEGLIRVHGEAGRKEAAGMIERLVTQHFDDAGIGTFSEIFDAEPPHKPRGCIAQAWSVAEVLRIHVEEIVKPEIEARRIAEQEAAAAMEAKEPPR